MNVLPRFRFRLEIKHLLWAVALIAFGLAFNLNTIPFSLLVIASWTIFFCLNHNPNKSKIYLALAIVALAIWALLPQVYVNRSAPRHLECLNNLRQIQLAILCYESEFGHFPRDTETTNSKGEVIRTSWRVHILPMLEMQGVYDAYRFDEPWNSPTNLALQNQLSWYLTCPAHDHGTLTPYKAVVGPGTAFQSGRKISSSDCKDGLSGTILLVEDHSDPVNVFEPRDISVPDAVKLFNNPTKQQLAHKKSELRFSRLLDRHHFTLLDGSTYPWPANSQIKIDEGAFLIADSTVFDPATDLSSCIEYRWDKFISLAIYLLLILYPLNWGNKRSPPQKKNRRV